MDRDAVVSPRAVEALIAEGQTIVIYDGYILRLDSWLTAHPGGRMAIMHMVGKDATDEMNVSHSARTLKTMKAFRIGLKPSGPWTNMTAPIRGGVFRKHNETDTDADLAVVDATSLASLSSGESDAESGIESGTDCFSDTESTVDSILAVDPIEPIERNNAAAVQSAPAVRRRKAARVDAEPPSAEVATENARMAREEYINMAVRQGIEKDILEYPPLEDAVQQEIVRKFRVLHQQVYDDGYYDCRYLEYGKEAVRYSMLFAMFFVALRYEWYMTSAAFLGLFWHQIMFTAHDAGHRAITHNFVFDTLVGLFIADFCCGLSIGWWKSSHNVHHLITNHPEHDPDIQNVPIFATCPSFFKSIRSTYYDGFVFYWDAVADFMVPFQKYSYYPIMGVARFNLYLLSWLHVLSSKASSLGGSKAWWIRPTEMACMACYWFLFGYCLVWRTLPTWTIRIAFVLVSHIITMPLHVQITLSHWGMSTSELSEVESFPQRQLRTTMDVDCPAWFDFVHGGLQFQAVHHLFPRVPRHNLRKLQALVKDFCNETGIKYSIYNFTDGNVKVLSRLEEVSEQLRMMASCQKYMAETGESGLH
ncbi:fatty acid desaturase [Lasiosphaeria hispida]|uniref:Delta 8-(E)-sphingolipid desaturase n=1 Tax=Lasiosphaeria hispida TaxID=260671 RepID=A0AAJ0HER1_9PEZI|nr:fatty acid desaturase [Lasiosphaeria hispida]